MRFSGHQPQYFPRLHYYARMLDSDIFEFSDYLQFVPKHAFPTKDGGWKRDKSHQAHTPIKLPSGTHYLTVPTYKGLHAINQTRINYDHAWVKDHLGSISSAYGRAAEYERMFPQVQEILSRKYANLAELNIKSTVWGLIRILGNTTLTVEECTLEEANNILESESQFRLQQLVIISHTSVNPPDDEKDATSWIIEMGQYFKAGEYFHGGTSAAAYLDEKKVEKAGIDMCQQNWIPPSYTQQFMKLGFLPNLSIIDLLMNVPVLELSAYFKKRIT